MEVMKRSNKEGEKEEREIKGRALQRHRDGERMQNEREEEEDEEHSGCMVERGRKKCAEEANRSR